MIAKTSIKQTGLVVALTAVGFYAGMFWSGAGDSNFSHGEDVSALKSRIADLEAELQTLAEQNQALQADREAWFAAVEPARDLSAGQDADSRYMEQAEPFPTEAESLAWAREAIWSDNSGDRIRAIETLIRLSPAEAVDAIRLIMSQADDSEDISLVASSLRQLANNQYLLNADLKQFYDNGDEQLQRAAANVLAQRGDDSLQQRYINQQYTIASQNIDSARRAEAVQKLTVFGKNPHAASRVLPLLEDPDSLVRLKAVSALAYTGDHSNIPAVQALLNDDVAAVRQRAEEVISALNRNDDRGLIVIPPPRAVHDGLPEELHSYPQGH